MNTLELNKKVASVLKIIEGYEGLYPPEFHEWLLVKLKGMYILGYNAGKKQGNIKGVIEGRNITLKQCSEMIKIFGVNTKAKIDGLIKINEKRKD